MFHVPMLQLAPLLTAQPTLTETMFALCAPLTQMTADLIWSATRMDLTTLSASVNLPLALSIRQLAMLIKLVPKSMESNNALTKHAQVILIVLTLAIVPLTELPPEAALSAAPENVPLATYALQLQMESATTLFAPKKTHAQKLRRALLIKQVPMCAPQSSAQMLPLAGQTTAQL